MARTYLLLLAGMLAGCAGLDKLLEGEGPVSGRLVTRLDNTALTVSQGSEARVVATVTKQGATTGAVELAVLDLPAGVTALVEGKSTRDSLTTGTIRIQVGTTTLLGVYFLKVRSRSAPLTDDVALLRLEVTPLTRLTVSLSRPALTVVAGGRAPVSVNLARANFPAPVTLTLEGPAGITGSFNSNPVTGTSSVLMLNVAAAMLPGSYQLKLRSSAAGAPDQETPLALNVTTDPIQVVVAEDQTIGQGAQASAAIIVNRSGYSGTVTLSVENLPPGVAGTLQPPSPQDDNSALLLSVGGQVLPGTYPVTVRGRGSGVPDAVTSFALTVAATSISLSLGPQSLSLLPGTSATSRLLLTRTGFTGAATLQVDGAPPGLLVLPDDPTVDGSQASLSVSAAGSLAPGHYAVTLRAVPVLPASLRAPGGGSAALSEASAQLLVTVHPLPTGSGNVRLTASGCTPAWVAYQDGGGPWIQVLPSAGEFAFTVSSERGGYAYLKQDSLVVRYALQSELSAAPIPLCEPPLPTKIVLGTARHGAQFEQSFNWFLGGAAATSSPSFPDFTLTGVREGVHDLVGWGITFTAGLRMLVRRDVDVANGASLGEVNLASGPESFVPFRPLLSVSGGSTDRVSHTMYFLTGQSCDAARLYTSAVFQAEPNNQQMGGVPLSFLRATDYHHVTILAQAVDGSGTTRTRNITFRALSTRSEVLPPHIPIPAVSALPGTYRRLQSTLAFVPPVYNGARTFSYTAGAQTASVSASALYTGDFDVELAMPDLSGVSGWPVASEIPPQLPGRWTYAAENAVPREICTDGRAAITAARTGTF